MTKAQILFSLFFLLPGLAHAHAVLSFPVPRNANSGNQIAPCGAPAGAPVAYKSGSTVSILWEETIHHTGSFQIYFSAANDANLSTGTTPGSTLLLNYPQNITDSNVPHYYAATVTLPNISCTNCTIQLVQTATNAGVNNPFFYFSCADISLSPNAVSPSPVTSPAPSPTVTASPLPVASGGTCAPQANPLSPTFSNVNSQIIQPMCISCHSTATTANLNTSLANYGAVLSTINLGSPSSSLIYQVTADRAMPQGAGSIPLSSSQLNLLLQWIEAGAPNN